VLQVFKRKGVHLIYNMHISLKEALCGTTRYIETLEMHEGKAKVLKIETVPGKRDLRALCTVMNLRRRSAQTWRS
jgi:DnaJ-class molecular chaperone